MDLARSTGIQLKRVDEEEPLAPGGDEVDPVDRQLEEVLLILTQILRSKLRGF